MATPGTTSTPITDIGSNVIVCRYDEIGIKGKNRADFERQLTHNLQNTLRPEVQPKIRRKRGRIYLYPAAGNTVFTDSECQALQRLAPRIFGLASASPGIKTEPDLQSLEHTVQRIFPYLYKAWENQTTSDAPIRYAMRVKRSSEKFPYKAREVEIRFADQLLAQYPRLKVDLNNPMLRIDVEIRSEGVFVCPYQFPGPGGLPVGVSDRITALFSGGIDSPVACHQLMKRGCPVDFVTFHSEPFTPPQTLTKTARLASRLNQWQQDRGSLIAVNLLPAQKAIRDACNPRLRTLLYRRTMMRLTGIIARYQGATALATGESLGQVASQTLPNMSVISAPAPLLVLRPLLCYDKKETVALARQIGTLTISQEEVPDSCTIFAPDNPVTNAHLSQAEKEESSLDMPQILHDCLTYTRRIHLRTHEPEELPGLIEHADTGQTQ